jgi:hypothetical protein
VDLDHWRVVAIRAILAALKYGTQGHSRQATEQLGTFE